LSRGESQEENRVGQPSCRPFKRSIVLACVACCSLAMLIWVKLRVVTGVPRQAYAEPDRAAPTSAKPAPPTVDGMPGPK